MHLFLDTAFVQALLNKNDNYHAIAKKLFPKLREAQQVQTTEAILVEIGNALCASQREMAVDFIEHCYTTPNIQIVRVNTILLQKGLSLYKERGDKSWGLTDCISFVVMNEEGLTDAMTTDKHFIQAGFCALMRENPYKE